jgi:thymidylate synthase (FAD)
MPTDLVKLVHCTPEAEHLITDMARVSAPKNQGNYDTAPRLIKYLIKHKHWSPFEMATMCVEINTTRDIAAQIIRHRSFSFQEFSQRYADVKELGEISVPELRRQDTKNRQNSVADLDPELVIAFERRIRMLFAESQELYDDMLEAGVAKECARKVLPMNSPSRIYMQGTLRSWMHYIQLREANGTQKEHQDIALACKAIFEQQFPSIAQALKDIESEQSYVVKETKVFEVPQGYLLVPSSLTQKKSFRERFRSWFSRNVFDLR